MSIRHVNVLEVETGGPGQTELNYLSVLIVFGFLLVTCVVFSLWQRHKLSLTEQQLDALTLEVGKLNASVSSKQHKESGKDVLSKLNHPILWSGLIDEAIQRVPVGIQLSQLVGSLSGKRLLVLIGNTKNTAAVFSLKQSLEEIPECASVQVANLNQSTFQIECQIQ